MLFAGRPELLKERSIIPEEREQAEEQRYRDGSQKQLQGLINRIDLLEKKVANLSLGTIDSFYIMFSDTSSVQNNNKNVNAYLTPNDTIYIDSLDLIE